MRHSSIIRPLRHSAALLGLAALAACGSATNNMEGAQPAPPEATGTLAHGDVLTRKQIQLMNANSMVDVLDGHFAGVQVDRASGRIVIRGQADPLVVVDGTPLVLTEEIWTLNPNDIERVQILKGDRAAIYGSRGGHGVILITTRTR